MSAAVDVAIWGGAFVATHLALSHPLRAPLSRILGAKGFLGVYSLIAFVTLGGMAHAYSAARPGAAMQWAVGDTQWLIASLLMWFASILLIGSMRGNPALPDPRARLLAKQPARGVYAITRHPMMWSFAIWAGVHALVNPTHPSIILSAAIAFMALVGAAGQDAKKRKLMGDTWKDWASRTSYLPFGRGFALPDGFALIGGTILFLVVSWAHGALGYVAAGFWRWL